MPSPSTSGKPPRRRFFELVFGTLSAVLAAAIGIPIVAAFLHPSRRRIVTGVGGASGFGSTYDLPIGVPQKRDVISARTDAWDRTDAKPIGAIWLVRRDVARVDAYSIVCPHLGCPIGYDEGKRHFTCPCHESAFALEDGRRLAGPSPRGLDPLPVEVRDGQVLVTYKQFIQGISSRREG
jgi:menaquinol-cytochrome c reductase iron-sulfur subunit